MKYALIIPIGIWCGLGLWCWIYVEWFSITQDYRSTYIKEEVHHNRMWLFLLFCLTFGPLAWTIT